MLLALASSCARPAGRSPRFQKRFSAEFKASRALPVILADQGWRVGHALHPGLEFGDLAPGQLGRVLGSADWCFILPGL